MATWCWCERFLDVLETLVLDPLWPLLSLCPFLTLGASLTPRAASLAASWTAGIKFLLAHVPVLSSLITRVYSHHLPGSTSSAPSDTHGCALTLSMLSRCAHARLPAMPFGDSCMLPSVQTSTSCLSAEQSSRPLQPQ